MLVLGASAVQALYTSTPAKDSLPRPLTSKVPVLTTYSSEAARPVSPSWMRIWPAFTLCSYISATILALMSGVRLSKSRSLDREDCGGQAGGQV